MTVSPTTEKAFRDAMARLLTGGAPHRRKLTKENLYREAGVSRATMNRASDVITDWDHAVSAHTGRPRAGDTSSELAKPSTKLSRKTSECADLQQRLEAAATTIAALHHDNNALRDELARHQSSKVIAIA